VRLWTLHPRYLDAAGLVALWREALLAQRVLRGLTRGYRHHPQLQRFSAHADPRTCIARFLAAVHAESQTRGYRFDRSRIGQHVKRPVLTATDGQLSYEWSHLKRKLRRRAPEVYRRLRRVRTPRPHPLFRIVPGTVCSWERRGRSNS